MNFVLRRAINDANFRIWGVVVALVLSLMAQVEGAWAQAPTDQWAAAIREQREAIATNNAARARCGGVGDPRCAALDQRGQLMNDNLAKLKHQYTRMGGREVEAAPPQRAPMPGYGAPTQTYGAAPRGAPAYGNSGYGAPAYGQRAAKPARGETPPGVASAPEPAPQQPRGFFSMLFGGGESSSRRSNVTIFGGDDPNGDADTLPQEGAPGEFAAGGTYRTLCVRTCDGYFFPVSFQASRGRLKTDANVCSALCPGTETRLFYHGAGQEAEHSVAADNGEQITKLPNAFLYRTKVVQGCACGRPDPRLLPAAAGGMLGRVRDLAKVLNSAGLPLPRPRPAPDQDPETQVAQISGFDPQPVTRAEPVVSDAAEPEQVAAQTTEPPKVRTVGPKFFSDR